MRRILIFSLGFMGCTLAAEASVTAPGSPARTIRVRISEATPQVPLRGFDLRLRPAKGAPVTADRASRWELRCEAGRIMAKGPRNVELAAPVTIESPAGFIHFRERPYRDRIRVHATGSLCEVVNDVDVERYLDGLVHSEFSPKWKPEAIAAQVVAARTYAYHQILRGRGRHYDVDSTVRDQVYDGTEGEDHRASRVVESTRGVILMAANAAGKFEPLKAFYHSTCGGRTELPEKVWGGRYPGFRRTVACPFCTSSPRYRWDLDLPGEEISDAFLRGAREGVAEAGWPVDWVSAVREGRLLDLRTGPADDAGRVPTVTGVWGRGKRMIELSVSGARFREWIGPGRLRSTAFQVIGHRGAGGKRWRFDGRGNGHGVGMCQWGAKIMGDQGHKAAAILKHYYPDAELRKVW
jgi:stage II sporulation protein D